MDDENKPNFFVRNLGLIISVVTLLAGIVGSYSVLTYRVGQLEKRMDVFQGSRTDVTTVVREITTPEMNNLRDIINREVANIRNDIDALRQDIRSLKLLRVNKLESSKKEVLKK
jgi:hypothetical protein